MRGSVSLCVGINPVANGICSAVYHRVSLEWRLGASRSRLHPERQVAGQHPRGRKPSPYAAGLFRSHLTRGHTQAAAKQFALTTLGEEMKPGFPFGTWIPFGLWDAVMEAELVVSGLLNGQPHVLSQ